MHKIEKLLNGQLNTQIIVISYSFADSMARYK